MTDYKLQKYPNGETFLRVSCESCGQSQDIVVSECQLKAWMKGELIQNAMPQLCSDERELLISGTCGHCFDVMMYDDGNESEDEFLSSLPF